ncbi:MAG: SagB/ThcOx family dehydrogenase [Promethearchaeia archaeon]
MKPLSEPNRKGENSFEYCVAHRSSRRSFSEKSIEEEKISQLLWAGQGKLNGNRASPSAGATYPLFLYLIKNGNELLKYEPNSHKLDLINNKEGLDADIARAALGQMFIAKSPAIIVICADYNRTTQRYGERGKRYVLIEVGHSAQNILLQATALNLVSVPIGAFKDSHLKEILQLPNNIRPLYILPVGYPK